MNANPWERSGYSEMVDAHLADDGELSITFANGDIVALPASIVAAPDGATIVIDPDEPMELEIVEGGHVIRRVSWSQIRAATDPAFAQHMRDLDADESRRLARRLKALREDRGIKQAELARILNMPAPQLSKIEKGSNDVRLSTVRALLRALDASFADVTGPDVPEVSLLAVARWLAKAGVNRGVATALLAEIPRQRALAFVEHVFGIARDFIDEGFAVTEPLRTSPQFKAASSLEPAASPLVHLAEAVAEAGVAATTIDYVPLPDTPEAVRQAIIDSFREVNLRSLLAYAWSHGIPVLPMTGSGGFAAAAWKIDDRSAIVLKDARDIPAFWMVDLGHEIGHIAGGHLANGSVVDVAEPTSNELLSSSDRQEKEANEFAFSLLVPDYRSRVREVERRSGGNYLAFKDAVDQTAAEHGVNAGVLGLISAYSLTDLGEPKDRWGSSINLSKRDGDARALAVAAARHYLDLGRVSDDDGVLLETVVLGGPNVPSAGGQKGRRKRQ